MKQITLIFATLCTVALSLNTYAQTLDESLLFAAENNPLLKAKYAEFEAAMQKVSQVNSLPDPTLSFGYFISPVETRVGPQRAKLGLSQMFPWFGTLKTAGEVQALQAEAKYQEFLNEKNELFMNVKTAWYSIYEVKQKIALQKENREILGTYKRLATTGYKNGKNTMVDVIRADIMIENSNTEIKLLQDQFRPLSVKFNKLLNREDTLFIDVEEKIGLIDIPLNYRKDSLLVDHPLLQSLDFKMQSAQQAEILSRKKGLPKFGIGLDYVFVGKSSSNVLDNGKDALMPMVSMSVPIYRGKYKAATKEAQFHQEAITNYRLNTENNLFSSYETALYELQKSQELVLLYETLRLKTNQAISLLETSYSNNGKDFEEILRMQQQLLKYQIAATTEIKKFYVALAKIDYLTAKTE